MIFHVVPGIVPYEGVFEFPLENNRVTIIMNDLITNVPHQKGFYGFLLRVTKSSGKPNVIPFVRRNLKVKKKKLSGECPLTVSYLADTTELQQHNIFQPTTRKNIR